MKRKLEKLILVLISLNLVVISSVLAVATSIIIITPQWPIAQKTPASLDISVTGPADPTYDPQILLAMTVDCYNGIDGPGDLAVRVAWTGDSLDFYKTDFLLLSGSPPPKVPPTGSDKQYVRSSLADHLGELGDSDVRWAMLPLPGTFPPDGNLHTTPISLTVTVFSTNPKVLVYALGKSNPAENFDRWVPPTNPGFVIPEPATIAVTAMSMIALVAYTARKKKQIS